MNGSAKVDKQGGKIVVNLTHTLDQDQYNVPLTLKTYVDAGWKQIKVRQGSETFTTRSMSDSVGAYVIYQAIPNGEAVEIEASEN